MAYSVKILADSINRSGCRLVTFEAQYPRCIHSEILTHRMLSRNSASSRAIPVEKLIQRVVDDPFIPLRWNKAQKGMVGGDEITDRRDLDQLWLQARDRAVNAARAFIEEGIHKTIPNRLLEPWMWITVLLTATDWDNFFTLRCAPDAEDHFQHLALLMRQQYLTHEPKLLQSGEWHLPLIREDDLDERVLSLRERPLVSAGRCARVSYLTHDGRRDVSEDLRLYQQLAGNRHMSPLEHPAMALNSTTRVRNFRGFVQLRALEEIESG